MSLCLVGLIRFAADSNVICNDIYLVYAALKRRALCSQRRWLRHFCGIDCFCVQTVAAGANSKSLRVDYD